MRWFGGCVPSSPLVPVHVPNEARLVWQGRFPLWLVGDWETTEIVQVDEADRSVVAIGTHRISAAALESWLTRRDSALPDWPGSYTVVMRDGDVITIFTDPAQAIPTYHASTAEGVVWGSSSRALAPLVGNTVDLVWLASAITFPAAFSPRRRSAFRGVAAVPPGHRLRLRPRHPEETEPWWSPPVKVGRQEASTHFRTALEEAVAVRLNPGERLSCDLSGGLDSTTLCLLATYQVCTSRPVIALTVRPSSVDHGGDLDYARNAARGRTHLTHLVLPLGTESDPYTALDTVTPSDEPAPTTITVARHRLAYQRLASLGVRRHMTGDGGDALLMQPVAYLSELLRHGRVLRAVRDAHGWAKLGKTSPWPRFRGLFTGPPGAAEPPVSWSTARARRLSEEHRSLYGKAPRNTDEALLAGVRSVARTARSDAQLAEEFRILSDNPFTDRTVVEAALRFPIGDRGSPWEYKPQITGSMVGLLPRSVLFRRTKGGTDADHHRGLHACLNTVQELVDGWLAGHGLVDPGLLRSTIAQAAAGLPTKFGLLEPTIAAEVWARGVTTAPQPKWTRINSATRTPS